MAIGFVSWMGYLGEQGYDFSYLDRERAIINLIQQKLSQQSSGFCCSHMSSSEIDYYLKEIPLKLSLREEQNAEQIFTNFSKAVIILVAIQRLENLVLVVVFLLVLLDYLLQIIM